jgi:tetratricopeptide (TPR) repeat protein
MEKDKAQLKIDQAWDCFQNKDYEQALKLCKSVLKNKKVSLNANYLLGHILFEKNEFENALEAFNTALTLDFKRTAGGIIKYWIAKIYEYTGSWMADDNPVYDKEKALAAYKESKQYDNYPSDTLVRLIAYNKSDFDKLFLFSDGIEKFPTDPYFHIYLGKTHKIMGYPSKQIEVLQSALSKGVESPSLLFNIGIYYFEQKDYQESLIYFTRCGQKVENNSGFSSVVFYCIGNVLFELKDYQNAIKNYTNGMQIDQSESSVWYNFLGLVLCYSKRKKTDDVVKLLNNISSDRDMLEYLSFEFGIMTFIDDRIREVVPLHQNASEVIRVIQNIHDKKNEYPLKLKTGLLLKALYEFDGNYLEQLKIIHTCLPYPPGYDFMANKLEEAYSNVISSADYLITAGFFINDVALGYFEKSSLERIGQELIKKLFEKKEYQKIVNVAESMNRTQIENCDVMFEYAYSLKTIDNWKDAKEWYESNLKYYPKSSATLNNLGVIYKEQGDYSKAISLYKEAIKNDSEEELYQKNLKVAAELLEKRKHDEKQKRIPDNWNNSIKAINVASLENASYFEIILKIEKLNRKYKGLIERDFKELTFNSLVGNYKSIVVLSGSLVEMILTYYCEKKKYSVIQVKDSKGTVSNKKLYDCVLNDLITFIEDKKLFGNDFHHLSSLARVYRNFIHPGLELKANADIKAKANICFISTIEILKKIL